MTEKVGCKVATPHIKNELNRLPFRSVNEGKDRTIVGKGNGARSNIILRVCNWHDNQRTSQKPSALLFSQKNWGKFMIHQLS